MTTANIKDFIAKFETDLSRPCNFEVQLIPPSKLINAAGKPELQKFKSLGQRAAELSSLRCEQAELPPRAFVLVEQKTYGPKEAYPIQNYYNKSSMTFLCSDNMQEKYFFDLWMDVISGSSPDYEIYNPNSVRFDFEYKNNYKIDVKIIQKDVQTRNSYVVVLREAFPVEVYGLPLSWAQPNAVNRLNVVFAYRYFYSETIDQTT